MKMEYYNFESCSHYVNAMEQLADVRLMSLEEGNGRGDRIITFRNGSGLDFNVAADRGMDLVDCSFRGIPLAFRTPTAWSAGSRHEPEGKGWLRNWQGGLMTTAGLRNVGVANGEFGQHGRISNIAADDVNIRRRWESGHYRLEASGVLREFSMLGGYIELQRTISTDLGDNSIRLCDRVVNRAYREDYLQILYHCNLGYPFASPDLVFETTGHEVTPRDAVAAAGIADWNRLVHPIPDFAAGHSGITVFNPKLGIRLRLEYSAETLPNFIQWKYCRSGGYALGLEPSNATVMGRTADIENSIARRLAPGESIEFELIFRFETLM